VIYRSNVRSALDLKSKNLQMDLLNDKPPEPAIKSCHDSSDPLVGQDGETEGDSPGLRMLVFNPSNLVGRTFLKDSEEDGQRFRACIVCMIEDHDGDIEDNPTQIKFICSINDDQAALSMMTKLRR